ncbi:hypothetical protein [Bradyrhizobium sp. CB2312]|uniref:hypothetical protein n=1 Tax=Bradyrhizobium sp. CB2312 TaxID=3039155 RepID=UPI0024B09E94|nr:hypothetical protein [Bradyrhizobium sp. CB2312]WFU76607.1 hypothetical protein QA642_22665 [Bradyrhizobium sp. CB2312]
MTKDEPLRADDFPIQTDEEKLKTRGGRPIASTESKELAEQVAERLNEHAYQEEQDRWSA